MMHYPEHLQKLIQVLRKLPGVGNKSAERFAFHLLNWSNEQLQEMGDTVKEVKNRIKHCSDCGCLVDKEACLFCHSSKRDSNIVCVIASPRDAFSMEETHEYRGLYHVLGGLLSPLDSRGPERLLISKLKSRILTHSIQEVVIALDSTLEGDATALYIKQELAALPIHVSRLAFGMPMGSSIDYVDGGTLARAFAGRNKF